MDSAPQPGPAAPGAAGRGAGARTGPADLLVLNGRVWTGLAGRSEAGAVAVAGDRIAAVGPTSALAGWRGRATTVIDARGARIVPGFNDSHVHLMAGGRQLDSVDLREAASPAELARLVGERAAVTPAGSWVLGGGWDEQRWDRALPPDRDLLDRAAPATPVFVARYDLHMAAANSLALELAGIAAGTPDPPGGVIVRDRGGRATGVLKDAAMALVVRAVPPPTRAQRTATLRRALDHAASLGVTSVRDMGPEPDDLAALAELADAGRLTLRVSAAPPAARWEEQANWGARSAFGTPWLSLGAVKAFADGSLGSSTALFFEPYADAPDTIGLLADDLTPLEDARRRLIAADAAGLQLCVHAIGDRAVSIVLDVFTDVVAANGPRDRRLRIEHAQHVAEADFDRFASLGVIAAVQPYHAIDDGRWAERRIGPRRIRSAYPFRTLLEKGVRLALGSDWPVAPLNPLLGIYAAATRATLDGAHPEGWVPRQKITVEDALRGYTSGSAYAEFTDGRKGVVAPGAFADLAILSDDILAIAPDRVREARVTTTIVGGRVVFDARG